MRVPPLVAAATEWTWRLLVLAVGAYGAVWFLNQVELLVLPTFAGLLITTLLRPAAQWLIRHRLPRALATWLVIGLGFLILGGIGALVVTRVLAQYPDLVNQIGNLTHRLRDFLVTGPLHLNAKQIDSMQQSLLAQLRQHQGQLASIAISGLVTVADVLAAAVLTLFITFFFVYDGERIWRWLVGLAPRRARWRLQAAGQGAWGTLAGYIRGTLIIAVFHGVVIGLALFVIGVPLVIPLALVVFLGSFIPLVGAVLAGTLAVGVALVSKGVLAALVVLAVLVLENQAEGHLLQPFVVGRYVRLHPLAIALVLAGGGFLQGIPGAIVAVPLVAAVTNAVRSVRQVGEQPPGAATDPPPPQGTPPS